MTAILLGATPQPGGGLVIVISTSPGHRVQLVTTHSELTPQLAADAVAAAELVTRRDTP